MNAIQLSSLTAAALIGLAAVSHAVVRFQGTPRGGPPPVLDDQGSVSPQAEFPIALVGDAMSLQSQGNETVIDVYNDSSSTRTFRVEWLYDLGGANHFAGQSGPRALAPGQHLYFTTANSGEPITPFFTHAGRDTTQDFVGRAIVYSDIEGYRGLGIEACEVHSLYFGFETAQNITQLNVYRITANGARQAGD